MADNLTPLPVKTKTDGDIAADVAQYGGSAVGASNAVHVQPGTSVVFDVDATGQGDVPITLDGEQPQVQGAAAENAAAAGNPVLAGGRYDATPRTLGDGDVGAVALDADGAMQVSDGGNSLTVDNADLSTLAGAVSGTEMQVDVVAALPAGDNNIGNVDIVSGPTGASALEVQGTAADGAAAAGDPVRVGGTDGSGNVQNIITDTDGHLQVDVLSGGGADVPSSPSAEDVTSASLAAGASTDLDSTDVGANTLYLTGVDIWASVPFKARIMTIADDVETVIAVVGGQAMQTVQWRPPHRKYVSQGPAGAGLDGFRVEMTNLDNSDAADVYATFYTEQ